MKQASQRIVPNYDRLYLVNFQYIQPFGFLLLYMDLKKKNYFL
nr:MAG TPA: hypothetical protein [Caudoviricetes sp.]